MIRPTIFHRLWTAPALATSERCADRWLGPSEHETLAELCDPPRRAAFLAGRILVKRIILEDLIAGEDRYESLTATEIEIISRDGLGRSGQPRVFLRGRQQLWNVSLAHSNSSVLAAVAPNGDVAIGVDLAPCDLTDPGFGQMWLTAGERATWLPTGDGRAVAKLWALKEAVYKAVGRGAPFVPTSIEMLHTTSGWTYRYRGVSPRTAPRIEVIAAGPHVAVLVVVDHSPSESLL